MKKLILRTAVILTAAATLFYSGCNNSANSDITSGGHVDDLIEKTRGTNEPKAPEAYTLKVTASPTIGGSVSKSPDKSQYSKGESVMLTATAETGYRFTGWSGSETSTGVEVLVKMDGNKELIANFLPENVVSYTLTINTSPTVGGTVSKSPDKLEYAAGDMAYVVAASKPGYTFTIWSGASSSKDSAITIIMDSKKELTANFAPRMYTLTANEENGGTVSRSPGKSAYEYNEEVTVTAYPDNGYKFTRWSGASTSTNTSITVTMDGDKTLTASFEWSGTTPPPNVPDTKYTLTAYPNPTNGGEVSRSPDKNAYTSGEKVTVTAAPANGYRFTVWSGASTSTSNSITVTMDGDKSLTAEFELITYTVTFNVNGGSGTIPNQSAQSGNSIELPNGTNLTKTGFTFVGWNTNATGTGTNYSGGSSFYVTSDVTLYVKWEILPTYTVTFNANGGSGTIASQSAQSGNSITLPNGNNLSRNGYTFGWWNTNSSGTGRDYSAGSSFFVTDDVTLFAIWNEVSVTTQTITFNAGGGTVNTVSGTTGPDGKLASLPTPTRTGYDFNGWYTAATGGTAVTESRVYSANTTIYAQWTPVTYTIIYNLDDGTVSSDNPASYTIETANFTLRNPTKTGYTFAGWTGTNGTATQTTVSIQRGSTGNRNYTANWTLIRYRITFIANGGAVTPAFDSTNTEWRLASLPTPTRTGYTFNGWYTTSTDGTQVTTSTAFSASATIYAQWTLYAYTITFNANNGTVSPTYGTTGADKKLASLPTPTRIGYIFVGWYTATTGGTEVTESKEYSEETTIYARWVNIYTVTFNANGGTVSPTSGTTDADKRLASLPTPTRTGFNFNGWFTAQGGTAVTINNVYNANTTIYAEWIQQWTVTFNANGGTVYPMSGETGAGRTLASLPTPTRSGNDFDGWYRFDGWYEYVDIGGKEPVTTGTQFVSNTTIYAVWTYVYTGRIVTIGTQMWMAENLNRETTESKCYENDPDNCAKYGRLYTWTAAKTACPGGWHLPSSDEWTTLVTYVEQQSGCSDCAGKMLKSTSGWYNNGNGVDEFGFSALPGGVCSSNSILLQISERNVFSGVGNRSSWWSAENAYARDVDDGDRMVRWKTDEKTYMSVRCVQD